MVLVTPTVPTLPVAVTPLSCSDINGRSVPTEPVAVLPVMARERSPTLSVPTEPVPVTPEMATVREDVTEPTEPVPVTAVNGAS